VTGEHDLGYESPTVPPGALFVDCDEPLRLFPSAAAAERHLQAIGIENGTCPTAYGPKGEVYDVRSENGRIVIARANEPDRPDNLKDLLLHYLECCEEPEDPTQKLDCLVNEAWSIERNYWLQNRADSESGGARLSIWSFIGFALVVVAILYLLSRIMR
jgi:hypothetical protein